MRKVKVYKAGIYAGMLREVAADRYEFEYDSAYLSTNNPAVSVTFPKQKELFVSEYLFPFFMNMLPEGVNRNTICRLNRIDENDYFGLLMFFSGKDIIGDISIEIDE